MYAIIETGGKQEKVKEGDVLYVEKLPGEAGSTIELDKVLAIGEGDNITIGKPYIENAKVIATILAQERGKKIIVFKKKRRKNYRRKKGHRQYLTKLKILELRMEGGTG